MSEVNAVCTKSTIVVWHMVSAQEIVALVCMLKIRSIFLSDKTKAISLVRITSASIYCLRYSKAEGKSMRVRLLTFEHGLCYHSLRHDR